MSAHSDTSLAVSRASLWFGILATPFAWSTQELVSYMLASTLCGLRAEGLAGGRAYALSTPFVAVTAATLALGLVGAWVAHANWRKVRAQRRHAGLDRAGIGIERARFLARCGLINAVVFLVAFAFTTANILVAPLCGT
ncbi:hypothetical protein E4K72_21995 [Oxalobacteraceae bacterium OM1]|nr:hypothetical protein E4K72_21995 [Oxalobacteraceae bacterium OM1]